MSMESYPSTMYFPCVLLCCRHVFSTWSSGTQLTWVCCFHVFSVRSSGTQLTWVSRKWSASARRPSSSGSRRGSASRPRTPRSTPRLPSTCRSPRRCTSGGCCRTKRGAKPPSRHSVERCVLKTRLNLHQPG